MTIHCEVHTENEAHQICHHCGKPVCAILRLYDQRKKNIDSKGRKIFCGYSIDDDEFYKRKEGEEVLAIHCEACLNRFHSIYAVELSRIKARL